MAKRAKSAEAPSSAIEATRLLGKWAKLAQGHVIFRGGCSCGIGFSHLRLQDFEPQILDYLKTRHGIGEFAGVGALLRSIATQGENGERLALLADLERSMDSFDELHGGR